MNRLLAFVVMPAFVLLSAAACSSPKSPPSAPGPGREPLPTEPAPESTVTPKPPAPQVDGDGSASPRPPTPPLQ